MARVSDGSLRRVLMTTDTVGGVWTFTLDLARELSARGIQVLLAALGGEASPRQFAEASGIPGLCLLTSEFKLEWMQDPWDDVARSGDWLLRVEREYAPDLVHLNTLAHGAFPWNAPALLTVHSCVLSWWHAVKSTRLPDSWDRYRREVGHSLREVSGLVTPSEAMAASLWDHYCIPRTQLQVIPNGKRVDDFAAVRKEEIVLASGRIWDEAKNMEALAAVAPRLPWPVCAAGDSRAPGGDSPEFGKLTLLGQLSALEMSRWFSRAAIFAHPACYEPFGLAALEAGLSGCALVLGDIPSQREIWGNAALFVPPRDTGALQRALEELIDDPVKRVTMARRARARASTFTSARMADSYLAAYRVALEVGEARCVS